MNNKIRRFAGLLGTATLSGAIAMLTACNNDNPKSVDNQLRNIVEGLGLLGDAAARRVLPDISDPVAQLGKKLFFSKALSGDLDTACVSCHHLTLGGGDDLSLSVGVEAEIPDLLGPGRRHRADGTHFDGGPTVPRNAPTTFNMGLWDTVLFLDGRVESLDPMPGSNGAGADIRTPDSAFGVADPDAGENLTTAQARFPVTSPEEMRGHSFGFSTNADNADLRAALERRLRGTDPGLTTNNWLAEFRQAFGDPDGTPEELITYANIAFALAEYERSQVFVDTPWRAYVQGDDDAIDNEAKRGALLFFRAHDDGGAGCAECHSGDFFTDEEFYTIAVPQIGRGKGDDNGITTTDDFGRFRETSLDADKYAFRTPTLLNVNITGPWGHDGAYTTLEGIVRHHLNPADAVANYDLDQLDAGVQVDDVYTNTGFALAKLEADRTAGTSDLHDVDLTDEEVQQLLAFLDTLTDPCVEDRTCLSPWISEEGETDPDGLRVNAVDQAGTPL